MDSCYLQRYLWPFQNKFSSKIHPETLPRNARWRCSCPCRMLRMKFHCEGIIHQMHYQSNLRNSTEMFIYHDYVFIKSICLDSINTQNAHLNAVKCSEYNKILLIKGYYNFSVDRLYRLLDSASLWYIYIYRWFRPAEVLELISLYIGLGSSVSFHRWS